MVMVLPIYEEDMTEIFYNTSAVIDADGKYLGKISQGAYSSCR
jgi:N-carbamoylputrescine amidase